MDGQKNKKDSLFSLVFPQPEPAHAPVAPPAAPPPAVSGEQAPDIAKKMELMERNILGRIEKKLSEQVMQPPPPPPSPAMPAVLSKITEMENRFKEFQDKFLLGAAQMKNIEESKISARREIEELLKAVREQQKYSELDRQMHAQLEKAWSRVEEMERRMLEAYSAAANKSAAPAREPVPPAPSISPEEIAAAVLKAVDARLEERLKPLEDLARNAAAKTSQLPELQRALEARLAGLSRTLEEGLLSFTAEIKQLGINAFAGKERLEDIVTDMKAEMKEVIAEALDRAGAGFVRHADAAALDGRERLDALSRMMLSHIDSIAAAQAAAAERITGLASGMSAAAEAQRKGALVSAEGLERALRERLELLAVQLRADNAAQLENVKGTFGLSSAGLAALSSAAIEISAIESRLGTLLGGVKGILSDLQSVNLEGVLGVSGAVMRKNLAALSPLCAELEQGTALIAAKRAGLESDAARLRPDAGGNEK